MLSIEHIQETCNKEESVKYIILLFFVITVSMIFIGCSKDELSYSDAEKQIKEEGLLPKLRSRSFSFKTYSSERVNRFNSATIEDAKNVTERRILQQRSLSKLINNGYLKLYINHKEEIYYGDPLDKATVVRILPTDKFKEFNPEINLTSPNDENKGIIKFDVGTSYFGKIKIITGDPKTKVVEVSFTKYFEPNELGKLYGDKADTGTYEINFYKTDKGWFHPKKLDR